jgi:hypothetical protein
MTLVGVPAKYIRRPSGEKAIEFEVRMRKRARGLVPRS